MFSNGYFHVRSDSVLQIVPAGYKKTFEQLVRRARGNTESGNTVLSYHVPYHTTYRSYFTFYPSSKALKAE